MINKRTMLGTIAALALAVPAHAGIVDISVDGAVSPGTTIVVDLNAELGTLPGGEVYVDGIGWDITLETVDPAWTSDATILFVEPDITLTPSGDTNPGPGVFSSGGIVDLIGIGLEFTLADGILTMEFLNTFDDTPIDWTGTVSFSATGEPIPTPEPGTLLLMMLAGLGLVARARKA